MAKGKTPTPPASPEPARFEKPLVHGFSVVGFRDDDPNGTGVPEGGFSREEVLGFLPDDLRAAVVEEGLAVDVSSFHPALFPVTLLVGGGSVRLPAEAGSAPDEKDLPPFAPAYRAENLEEFASLDGFRAAVTRDLGSGAGLERFYRELERRIAEALRACKERCRKLKPVDCTPFRTAVADAEQALRDAETQVPPAEQALAGARQRKERLRRQFEQFAKAISDPAGTSSVTIEGVTLGFPTAAAADRVLTAWNDEIGRYIRAFARINREIDRLEQELEDAREAVEQARQALAMARRALADCLRRQRATQRQIEDCQQRCLDLEALREQARREREEARRRLEEERRRREQERRDREERQRQAAEAERRRRQQNPPQPPPPPLPEAAPALPEPQELDGLQIRQGIYFVAKEILLEEFDPCPRDCWAAIGSAAAIAADLVRKLGWDLIGTFLSFIPAEGLAAKLFFSFLENLTKFASSDTLSEGASRALGNILGGAIFGRVLGDTAGTGVNNLTSDQFVALVRQAFEEDGIRMVEVEGTNRRGNCKARVRVFYNPKTGQVVVLARCTCCPGLYTLRYMADKNGLAKGRITRRILR